MTIHHDKLAYGKVASPTEDMTEEQIAEMLKTLAEEEEANEEEKDGENKPQK